MNLLKGLLIFWLLLGASGVDRNKFKTCEKSSFCKRQRATVPPATPFAITKPESIRITGSRFSVDVTAAEDKTLGLEVSGVEGGPIRVRLDEINSPYKRFRADVALREDMTEAKIVYRPKPRTISVGKDSKVQIHFEPFSLEFFSGSTSALHWNKRGLFNWEFYHSKPAEGESYEEMFDTHRDSRPHGPTSVGADVSFTHADHVYGIPEHATNFSLPATRGLAARYEDPYRLYNLDVFEYELDNPMALYGSVPFMVGHSADVTVGLLWLNAAETWVDVDRDTPSQVHTHWMSESGIVDFFFLPGPRPSDVMRQYALLTGMPSLPPHFGIGYQQCKWNYRDEADVAMVDATFDENNIPFDVIWLDIEHTDGKRYFTWDKTHFPTPEKMLRAIANKGRKMVTIVDPHLKRDDNYKTHKEAQAAGVYVKDRDGNEYDGWCWPGSSSWPDFTRSEVREWWATLFRYDHYVGSSGILHTWNDMNEPSVFNGPEVTAHKDAKHGSFEHRDVHNLFGQLQHRATAEGLTRRNEPADERPFVLSRAFFAGTQRYGPIWTGDNTADWTHLAAAQPMLLSLNVAGITFSGADVGGFFGNPNGELITRWYQAAAFQPFFRGHAHLDSKRREPWLFGEPYTSIIAASIRLRYALLPYLYSAFHEASTTGMPVMRPLMLQFPADDRTFSLEHEFLVGDSLLVCPVVKEGATSASVYLPPAGEPWYDYHTLAPVGRSGEFEAAAPLDRIPIYLMGGKVVARQDRLRRSTAQMRSDPYTLVFALNSTGAASGSLYVDDGHSFGYQRGEYALRELRAASGKLSNSGKTWASLPNTVERIIIVGVRAQLSAVTSSGNALQWTQVADRVVIRKPGVYVAEDWVIEFR